MQPARSWYTHTPAHWAAIKRERKRKAQIKNKGIESQWQMHAAKDNDSVSW
jgi:hypothetical protein